jgi:hypothetical protein
MAEWTPTGSNLKASIGWDVLLALSRTHLNQQHDQDMSQNFTSAYLNWHRVSSIERLLSPGSKGVIQ